MISDLRIAELKAFPEKLCSELVKPKISKLWYRGEWDQAIFTKCVAVIGSRKMSRYGRQVIAEIVPKLCVAGFTIVSGLMYGIDQEAHKIALECGGRVIGVLGYGHGVKIEDGADRMQEEIVESGGIVMSEYMPTTVPQRFMFLQRNRIVVAISEVVIVVEAGEKSGSLHTAGLALKQQKDLYAVPGGIFSPTSVGTNNLITNGVAKALTIASLDNLTMGTKMSSHSQNYLTAKIKDGERKIMTLLKVEGPMSVNEIARIYGEAVGEILSKLMKLEIMGMVTNERGIWRLT